jgi:AraC-like DNA-binding protein
MTAVQRLSLHRRTTPTEPCTAIYQPSLIGVAQGRKQVALGGASFVYDRARFLLTSLDLPIVSRVIEASQKSPCLAMMLRLRMETVREVLSGSEPDSAASPAEGPAIVTGCNTPGLVDACSRLVGLLENPEDISFLAELIEREIIYRLLQGPAGGRLRAIATRGEKSQRAAASISWLCANYTKPLRIAELARIAGMAVSTFHHHFRTLTAMSPLQYQKQLRLQHAHILMLVERLDAAQAAFAVGYESTSQFSREYSRLFGQSPRRNVKSLRDEAA